LSKLRAQPPRFGLLGSGLIALILFTGLGGLWNYQGELTDQLASAQTSAITAKPASPNPAAQAKTTVLSQGTAASSQPAQAGTAQPQSHTGLTAAASTAQAGKASPANPASTTQTPATVSLALSINGQAKGNVTLPVGSDQCDVLSQALTDGVISSLDMSYSAQYGTEAVYVIDGIGDPSSVWWTYTVNGHAPPYGCAYVTAHNGDSVNWQYVKS
jgi:hypothetical protein